MKAPPPATRVLGHPILSGLLLLVGGAVAIAFLIHGTQGILPAIIVGALLNRVMKAQEQERDYRAWKRAWNAMDPAARASRRAGLLMARTIIVIAVALYGLAHLADAEIQVALAFIGAGLLLWFGVALARRLRRNGERRRTDETAPVRIGLRGPLLPVPSLPQAYAALPDHCQRLLRQP
jgi:hypothetical protein